MSDKQFILSCESTVDLPFGYINSRGIPVIFYSYISDGAEYEDDMGRNPSALPEFYDKLERGILPKSSQIVEQSYYDFLGGLLDRGDVLHIAFGSGMTPSVNNALAAAERLRQEHPERKLIVIDSTCSSSGYGLLVDDAADLRDEGKSIEDVAQWVEARKRQVHHQFFSTDLTHYRRSGRMSGPTAMIGNLLGICPIMRLDYDGKIVAYDKVRTRKKAIERTVDIMQEHAEGDRDYDKKCFICHSNCLDIAQKTAGLIKQRFESIKGDIRICDIGSIIAGHCGPGTVAIFFYGDERPDMSKA